MTGTPSLLVSHLLDDGDHVPAYLLQRYRHRAGLGSIVRPNLRDRRGELD